MGSRARGKQSMKNLPTFLGQCILAAVLALAASAKLTSPESFQASLESFKLFPKLIVPTLSYFVPIMEMLTAFLLVLKGKELVGAATSFLLSVGFVCSLSWAVVTKSTQDCGCFGEWELAKVSPELALLRAITILSLSALLILKLSTPNENKTDKKYNE